MIHDIYHLAIVNQSSKSSFYLRNANKTLNEKYFTEIIIIIRPQIHEIVNKYGVVIKLWHTVILSITLRVSHQNVSNLKPLIKASNNSTIEGPFSCHADFRPLADLPSSPSMELYWSTNRRLNSTNSWNFHILVYGPYKMFKFNDIVGMNGRGRPHAIIS